MKKFLVTILALVYLATTTGATLHMHYCMGEIYSVDLAKKDGCTKCGMEAGDDCCTDELTVIKVKDNHQLISNDINFAPSLVALLPNYNIAPPAINEIALTSATNNNSPPGSSGTSLYIINSVFRL